VVTGLGFTTALTSAGKVLSWGPNHEALGHPLNLPQTQYNIPSVIEALTNVEVIQIASSGEGTVAVTQNGSVYIWGKFNAFQTAIPIQIKFPIATGAIVKVAATVASILLLSKLGDIYYWNFVVNGSLQPEFTILNELQDKVIKDVACGSNHALFLTNDGQVYALGTGQFGQLVSNFQDLDIYNLLGNWQYFGCR
jgi:alpha-tubulin suppressor-like RCC1 family protein